MALNLLLVDPNDEWRAGMAATLKDELYQVTSVDNGKDAQIALYNDKFFAVIINLETQNHSGTQVLKFIKTNHPSQRVILLLESKKVLEESSLDEETLIKMGATEILTKPFESGHLVEALAGHQSLGDVVSTLPKREGVSDEEQVDAGDDEFTSIKIDEFYPAKAVLFNVFIKLGSGKYVKILHAGDAFSKDRIDKYKNEKKVEELYFHKKDRRKYIQYNNFLAGKLAGNKQVGAASKAKILRSVSNKYLEEVYTSGMKPQVIEQGREVVENVYKLVETSGDLHTLLRDYQEFDPAFYTHSFLTTLFSSAVIKQFEWQSKVTIESAALACMFHDIGKMQLPKELLDMRPEKMNEEQLALYQQHPELGLKMVEGNRLINNSIKQIILQHHEYYDGTGFPHQKKGSKILTLANIVCLVDDFVHIMMEEELKPTDALKKIVSNPEFTPRYNSVILQNFIKVFVDPGKIQKEEALPSNSRMVPNKKVS